MKNFNNVLVIFFGWIIGVIIIGIVCIFPIMWMWNWLVPELFNGPTITFWQTAGLYLLINLLIRTNVTINNKHQNSTLTITIFINI